MDPCVAAEGAISQAVVSQAGGLPGRYAAALYDLADEQRELDAVVDQVQSLGRLIDESAPFRRLLSSPLVDVTQARAAEILGVPQPKVSALLRGDFTGFSLERLFRLLISLDNDISIVVAPKSNERGHVNVVARS